MDSTILVFFFFFFSLSFFTASADIFAHCQKLHIHVAGQLKTLDIRLCACVCLYTHNIFRLTALIGVGLALLRHAGQCLAGDGVIVRAGRVHFDGRRFAWLICSFRHCRERDRGGKREREWETKKKGSKHAAQILKRCNWQ